MIKIVRAQQKDLFASEARSASVSTEDEGKPCNPASRVGSDLFQKVGSRAGHSHQAVWAQSPQTWRRAQNPRRVQIFAVEE